MAGSISIPLPAFQQSFPDAFTGNLTIDGKSVVGNFNIFPGVKIEGVEGSETTIGGFDASVEVSNAKASFSGNVDILKQSYTFKDGEELSLKASVTVGDIMQYTFVLAGSDIKPKAVTFDKEDSGKLSGGSANGSVHLMEDPLFAEAGIFVPGFDKFKRWVQKLTISFQATLEGGDRSKGDTGESATLTRTLEWSLRPLFGKSSRKSPKTGPPPFLPPPERPKDKIPIIMALPQILYLFMSGYQSTIFPLLSTQYLQTVLAEISSVNSNIQKTVFNAINEVAKAKEAVENLSNESAKLTEEIEAVEVEIETAGEEIVAFEEGIEAAEGALAVAETAETAAVAEVSAAAAAEAAATASEAADWWTIIGGIISGAAIAAATAAVVAAVRKKNEATKKKKEAQAKVNEGKANISQEQLKKKRGETTKLHKRDELRITEEKLQIAKRSQLDVKEVKDIFEAAHVGLENMQKEIKTKLKK